MDFLKTLLAYMALLTTLGVQEGPAPQTVPTPTPLPAHITASPVPHQTAAPTATPSPSPEPKPTLTPNTRYAKLSYGDSGNNVRKLQNRLIELGYMSKGSADGAFGYQTLNAVKAFQKANKLSADGVAGPATLTNLYENPDVIGVVAATEVPTATPSPTLPPLPTPDGSAVQAAPTAEPAAEARIALTELEGAYIISGNDGKTLYRETLVDGQPALVKPDLWVNESGAAVVSLAELADCLDGWTLMGSSSDGLYALQACGYTVSLHVSANAAVLLVDGKQVQIADTDAFIQDSTLYVTDGFLRAALKAETVFDADESTLLLFLKDKSVADAQD